MSRSRAHSHAHSHAHAFDREGLTLTAPEEALVSRLAFLVAEALASEPQRRRGRKVSAALEGLATAVRFAKASPDFTQALAVALELATVQALRDEASDAEIDELGGALAGCFGFTADAQGALDNDND